MPESKIPPERRASLKERRENARTGKIDRRRKRCGQCQQFDAVQGFCNAHQAPVAAEDFACVVFEAST